MANCETCHGDPTLCPKEQAFKAKKIFGFNNETGEITSDFVSIGFCPEAIGMQKEWAHTAQAWLNAAQATDREIIDTLATKTDFTSEEAKIFFRKTKPLLDQLRDSPLNK